MGTSVRTQAERKGCEFFNSCRLPCGLVHFEVGPNWLTMVGRGSAGNEEEAGRVSGASGTAFGLLLFFFFNLAPDNADDTLFVSPQGSDGR